MRRRLNRGRYRKQGAPRRDRGTHDRKGTGTCAPSGGREKREPRQDSLAPRRSRTTAPPSIRQPPTTRQAGTDDEPPHRGPRSGGAPPRLPGPPAREPAHRRGGHAAPPPTTPRARTGTPPEKGGNNPSTRAPDQDKPSSGTGAPHAPHQLPQREQQAGPRQAAPPEPADRTTHPGRSSGTAPRAMPARTRTTRRGDDRTPRRDKNRDILQTSRPVKYTRRNGVRVAKEPDTDPGIAHPLHRGAPDRPRPPQPMPTSDTRRIHAATAAATPGTHRRPSQPDRRGSILRRLSPGTKPPTTRPTSQGSMGREQQRPHEHRDRRTTARANHLRSTARGPEKPSMGGDQRPRAKPTTATPSSFHASRNAARKLPWPASVG